MTTCGDDRRYDQVGLRKAGYLGHVPRFRQFDKKIEQQVPPPATTSQQQTLRAGLTSSAAGSRASVPAPTSTPGHTMISTPTSQSFLPSSNGGRTGATTIGSWLPPNSLSFRPGTSAMTSKSRGPSAPLAGYCGHRRGAAFVIGVSAFSTHQHTAADGSPQLHQPTEPSLLRPVSPAPTPGSPSPPRYPVIRGPTRQTPLGYEVFLTN
jgi:hypothetical protein